MQAVKRMLGVRIIFPASAPTIVQFSIEPDAWQEYRQTQLYLFGAFTRPRTVYVVIKTKTPHWVRYQDQFTFSNFPGILCE
jgi:hypothetical protein